MDAEKKKKVKVSIVAGCIAIVIIITVVNMRGGSGDYGARGSMQVLCTNEDCGKDFMADRKKVRQHLVDTGRAAIGAIVIVCPECGQESGLPALKCGECGEVFLPDYRSDEPPDTCPNCGHSVQQTK